MNGKLLLSRFALISALIFGGCIFLILMVQAAAYRRVAQAEQLSKMGREMKVLSELIEMRLRQGATAEELLAEYSQPLQQRLTLFDAQGRPWADSLLLPRERSPEVNWALQGEDVLRKAQKLDSERLWLQVWVPVRRDGVIIGVLHSETQESPAQSIWIAVWGIGLLGWLVWLWWFSRIWAPWQSLLHWSKQPQRPAPDQLTPDLLELAQSLLDLQDRKQLAERRQQAQQEEERAVLDSMGDGLLILDAKGNCQRWNPAALRMLCPGQTMETGKPLVASIPEHGLLEMVAQLLATHEPQEARMEILESERVLEVAGRPIPKPDGGVRGFLLLVHDSTKLYRLEKVRREFVSNVSHELKTPITAISGYAQALAGLPEVQGGQAAKFAGIIAKHTKRLELLTEDLLQLARMEEPGFEAHLEKKPVPVEALLQQAFQSCEFKAEQQGVEVDLQAPPDLVVLGDAKLLHLALVNLLDNAIKYSEPQSRVLLAGEPTEAGVQISVQDQGVGIPKKDLERVFERFYRVDEARHSKTGGTGLGLSIVRRVVWLHGGKIHLESQLGKGSKFMINLPK